MNRTDQKKKKKYNFVFWSPLSALLEREMFLSEWRENCRCHALSHFVSTWGGISLGLRHRMDRLSAGVVVSIQRYMLRKLTSVCFYLCPPLLHSQHVPPHPPPPLPQQAGLTGCPSIEMPAAFTCHPQFSILHEETARLENNGPFPSSYFKLRGRKKDLVFITHKPDLRIKVITVQM